MDVKRSEGIIDRFTRLANLFMRPVCIVSIRQGSPVSENQDSIFVYSTGTTN